MAPWNELMLACSLRADTPQQVIDILMYMMAWSEETYDKLTIPPVPDHFLFRDAHPSWEHLLATDTPYFRGSTFSNLTQNLYQDDERDYELTIRAMARKGAQTIASFLHWLAPYSDTEGFVGYTRCDEIDIVYLVHFENGNVYYSAIEFYKKPPEMTRYKILEDGDWIKE